MERRLSAILAADLVGYSRLMEADEHGTLSRVLDIVETVLRPNIEEHSGRVIKLMGDGILAEFPSVLAAVTCAIRCQKTLAERNRNATGDDKAQYRFGINLGDVILESDDIFGHGVNVAARLESLAEPGEIYISRPVRDQIRDRLDCYLEDKGSVSVKNIRRPVRVFRVVTDPREAERLQRTVRGRTRRWRTAAVFAAVVLGIVMINVTQTADLPSEVGPPKFNVAERTGKISLLRRSNLRFGPGTDFQIAQTSDPGTEFRLMGETRNNDATWYQVTVDDHSKPLFVHGSLARLVPPDEPEPGKLEPIGEELVLTPAPEFEAVTPDLAAAVPTPEAEPVKPLAIEQNLWVRVSLDLTSPVYADCTHHTIQGVHKVPMMPNSEWRRLPSSPGDDFDLAVRAFPKSGSDGVVVEVLPYATSWKGADAVRMSFDDAVPGRSARAFTKRRALNPHEVCGTFVVYLDLVEAPGEDR